MKRLVPQRLREARPKLVARIDWLLDNHPVGVLLVVAAFMFIIPLVAVGIQYERTNSALTETSKVANSTADLAKKTAKLAVGNRVTLRRLDEERIDRLATIAGVQKFVCQENNKQDLILGKLLTLSLRQSPQQKLTPEQMKALLAFQNAAIDLNDTPNCNRLVALYLRGTGLSPGDVPVPHLGG